MKKLTILITVIIGVVFFTSCQKKTNKSVVLTEQQVIVTEPNFFYLVKERVEKGYTLWDRAKVNYGDSRRWRDFIAQNKFLQEPGRIWKDTATGIWYALIRPGEELVINSNFVNPVFIDIIEKPTQMQQPTEEDEYYFPVWGWIIVGLLILGLLIWLIMNQRNNPTNNQSNILSVIMHSGGGLESSTLSTIYKDERDFRNRNLKLVEDQAALGNIKKYSVEENLNDFSFNAEFFKKEAAKETEK